jgi:hypothetical protein
MKRANVLASTLIAGLSLVATTTPSHASRTAAEYFYMTGVVCQPPAGHAGFLDYRETGVGNTSTTSTAEVFCPTYDGSDGVLEVDWLEVGVIDASNQGAVSCYMYGSDFDDATIWSPTKSTTTSDSPSPGWWTGSTKLFFDAGAMVNGNWAQNQRMNWSIRCYLPAQTGTGMTGRSWVKQILLGADSDWDTAEP